MKKKYAYFSLRVDDSMETPTELLEEIEKMEEEGWHFLSEFNCKRFRTLIFNKEIPKGVKHGRRSR